MYCVQAAINFQARRNIRGSVAIYFEFCSSDTFRMVVISFRSVKIFILPVGGDDFRPGKICDEKRFC